MSVTNLRPPSNSAGNPRPSRRVESARVMQALDQFCASLQAGDRVPTHSELMRQFGASERTVLRSLDELQRQGRIVRKHGAGTFIADGGSISSSSRPVPASRTIVAVAMPDRSFFDRCMEQLYQYAAAADLGLVCRPLDPERDTSAFTPAALGWPLGFVLFGYALLPLARRIQSDGGRVVIVGTPPLGETPGLPCVYGAQEQGGYLSTKHLIDLGHRRISFITSVGDIYKSFRWQGVQRALREAQRFGQQAEVSVVDRTVVDDWRGDISHASAFIRRADAPTAIMAWNDHEAARILSLLLKAGVDVPGEVSLIGYDALPEGELVHPTLTTVDPYLGQLLQMAVNLLTQETAATSHTAVVIPSLIPRDSTAPPKRQNS